MNFKKKIFTTLKAISILLIALLIVFKCILIHVENKIINNYSTDLNTLKDTVIIHFIHGSIPMKDCIYPRERLGGLLGGHVEIEINKHVYGFRLNKLPVHIFVDNAHFNSRFEINTHDAWIKRTEYEKMTSIYLPINNEQKDKIQGILDAYLAKSPYDYAFFGTRCASSTADILSKSGIIAPLSNAENMIAFLSPHPLRHTLLNLAEKKNFLIINKKGVDCRFWE
jgi:hypothetical protein